jgi:methyl-accepting chemotaxis protein
MIAAIQSGTRDAVASMQQGVSRVTEGVALATQAGASRSAKSATTRRQVVEKVAGISDGATHEQSVGEHRDRPQRRPSVARMAEENCAAGRRQCRYGGATRSASRQGLEAEVRRFRLG